MKISVLSVVYNECDVIELFIRINSRYADHLYIVDNGSIDATPAILKKLQDEGFPITVCSDFSLDFHQKDITTRALRNISNLGIYDWILILDADEFLTGTRNELENELSALPPATCASLNWKTYVPKSNAYFKHENPIFTLFTPRKSEHRQYCKAIIPGELGLSVTLSSGNHAALHDNQPAKTQMLGIPLAHCPIRSSSQIISKVIMSYHKKSFSRHNLPGESFHIYLMADMIRNNEYDLDDEKLRRLAFGYALHAEDPVGYDCDSAPLIGLASDKIVYRELSRINLISRFDGFIKTICDELNKRWDFPAEMQPPLETKVPGMLERFVRRISTRF